MLYLVQHGQATTEEEDPERPLTSAGRDDVARVAQLAVSHLSVAAEVRRVLHSGKTRALQTAEIWGQVLGGDVSVDPTDGLAPRDDPGVWATRVGAGSGGSAGSGDGVMLVGHMPHLGALSGVLLAGDAEARPVRFTPGVLVALRGPQDGWSAVAVIPPPPRR